MDAPLAHGGLALPMLDQVAIVERFRPGHQCAGLVLSAKSRAGCSKPATQISSKRFILPMTRGEVHLVLCHHRGRCRLRSSPPSRRRRCARATTIVINGEKWHVTSPTSPTPWWCRPSCNGGEHCLFFCRSMRRASRSCARPPMPIPTTTIIRSSRFNDVAVPVADRIGEEGDGHGLHLCLVPPRAPDDRGALLRRHGRAADRGGHRIRQDPRRLRRADRRIPARSRPCSPTAWSICMRPRLMTYEAAGAA